MRHIGIIEQIRERLDWRKPNTPQQNVMIQLVKYGVFDDYAGYQKLSDNPDVIMAVNKIADLVSSMTIHLVRNTENGDERVHNGLSRKIDIEPCKNMTRKTWITKIVRDLLLYGDGNAIVHVETINEDGEDLIGDMTPFDMNQVSYETVGNNDYKIHYKGKIYSSDTIMHFVINPDPDQPFIGTGYRINLADIVKNLNQANHTKNSFMSGKYMPNLIVKVDAYNDALGTEEGQDEVKQKYLRSSKAGEPWVIPAELLEVQQVKPLSLNDIAINESTEIDKKTIAGLFGVPAFFLGVGEFDKNEYNNFINTRIMSIAQTIAQTMTRDLLYSPEYYIRLNARSLYSYALSELVNSGGQMVKMNAMRRNELRDWVGLDPDPEMEELIVLENYIPVDQLGDQEKLQGGEAGGDE